MEFTFTCTIFVYMKAKPLDKPRVIKTFRLNGDLLRALTKFCKGKKKAETEVVEAALYDYISR